MSVVVLVRRRTRPGHEEAVVQAVLRYYQDPAALGMGSQRNGRLFQAIEDPCALLSLAHRDSRGASEAFLARVRGAETESLFEDEPIISYCRALASFEQVLVPTGAAGAVLFDAPEPAAATLAASVLDCFHTWRDQYHALLWYELLSDEDRPGCIALLHGWRTEGDLTAARGAMAAEADRQARRAGASLTRFDGRLRAEYQR